MFYHRLVQGYFFSKKHINTVQLVPVKLQHNEMQVMLFVCKNDGEVSCKCYQCQVQGEKY